MTLAVQTGAPTAAGTLVLPGVTMKKLLPRSMLKIQLAEVLGRLSSIDQDFMQKHGCAKTASIGEYELQPGGLHWGDTGHSIAAFVAQVVYT